MKIYNGHIEWYFDFANRPSLTLNVDDLPEFSSYRFEQKESFFFAEQEGICEYFHWDGFKDDTNSGGYGGNNYEIIMRSGETKILKGPWSSNCKALEKAGFGKSINVAVRTEKSNVLFSVNLRPWLIEDCLYYLTPFISEKILLKLKPDLAKKYEKCLGGIVRFDFNRNEPYVHCLDTTGIIPEKLRTYMSNLASEIIDRINENKLPYMIDVKEICGLAIRAATHGIKDNDYRHVIEMAVENLEEGNVEEGLQKLKESLRS